MRELAGKVAVITGAASGIGRGLAGRCAREGMKVVLADVERAALATAEAELRAEGAEVLAVPTDVAEAGEVEALARRATEAFGAVHLLCNNAGVGAGGMCWEHPLADWRWVLGVNLWGVIHGIRTFVPLMLRQGGEAHVVNTASMAGLTSAAGNGIYAASKHAVVSLSETLYLDLRAVQARIGVSVLCPAWVRTRIADSDRNRPDALRRPEAGRPLPPEWQAVGRWMRRAIETGTPPEEIAGCVLEAVREGRLYVLPHPEWRPAIEQRMQDILQRRNPVPPPPPPELARELARG